VSRIEWLMDILDLMVVVAECNHYLVAVDDVEVVHMLLVEGSY